MVNIIGKGKWTAILAHLVGIAKHLNIRTDRQSTYMNCPVPCIFFMILAISQDVRHFLILINLQAKIVLFF